MVDVSNFLGVNTLFLFYTVWLRDGKSSLQIQSITNKLHRIFAVVALCRVFVLICFAVTHFNESVNINTVMVLTSDFPFSRVRCFVQTFVPLDFWWSAYFPSCTYVLSSESTLNTKTDVRSLCLVIFVISPHHRHRQLAYCCKQIRWTSTHTLTHARPVCVL